MTIIRRIGLGTLLSLCMGMLSACGGGGGGGSTTSGSSGSFTLNTTNVSFTAAQTGAAPAAQTVIMHITSSGAATAGAGYANGTTPAS